MNSEELADVINQLHILEHMTNMVLKLRFICKTEILFVAEGCLRIG